MPTTNRTTPVYFLKSVKKLYKMSFLSVDNQKIGNFYENTNLNKKVHIFERLNIFFMFALFCLFSHEISETLIIAQHKSMHNKYNTCLHARVCVYQIGAVSAYASFNSYYSVHNFNPFLQPRSPERWVLSISPAHLVVVLIALLHG